MLVRSSHGLIGEDLERSRYTRVLPVSIQPKLVHKEERDMKISLNTWHTLINAIKSWLTWHQWRRSHESGIEARTSGGIWLIRASLLSKDRIWRGTS